MSTSSSKPNPDIPKIGGLKTALRCGLGAAVIGAVISLFMPNYYISEVRILPGDSKASGGLGQLAAAAAMVGVGLPGADSPDANFADIIKSRLISEELLNKEYQFHVKTWRYGKETMRRETLYNYLKAKNMDRAVKQMGDIVSVLKDSKTKILVIKAETKSPQLSQEIADGAAMGLEKFLLGKGRSKGSEKARFAEERLKDARAEMSKAEDTFRLFIEGNRNYQSSSDPTTRLTGVRLEAELKLRQQLVLTLSINRENALMDAKNDVPIVNILDDANLPIDSSRISGLIVVILAFSAAMAGAWVWLNREWIQACLVDSDKEIKGQIYHEVNE